MAPQISPLTREETLHMGIVATWLVARWLGEAVAVSGVALAHETGLPVQDARKALARLAVRDALTLEKRADTFTVEPIKNSLDRWVRVLAEDALAKRVAA